MMRGPRPKPANLRLIEGNPAKRAIKPQVQFPRDVIPEAPDHINALARQEWDRVASGLHALRLLEQVDRAALAAYCTAYARWVQAERAIATMAEQDRLTGALMIKTSNGNAIQNPLVSTSNKAMHDMVRYAAEFGMSPAARARVAAEGGAAVPASKWAGLIGGGRTD